MNVQEVIQTARLGITSARAELRTSAANIDKKLVKLLDTLDDNELAQVMFTMTETLVSSTFVAVTGKIGRGGLVDRTVTPGFRKKSIITAPITATLLALLVREYIRRSGDPDHKNRDLKKRWQKAKEEAVIRFEAQN